jgi:hypothetical protein
MLHDSAYSAAPTKPGLLTAGFVTVMVAVVSAIASGVLWVVSYRQLMAEARQLTIRDPEAMEAIAVFDGMVYIVVGLSIMLALGLAAGGVLMMYGKNAGRILVWAFGGVSIGWRICCGTYSSIILYAIYDVSRRHNVPDEFPMVELTTATVLDLLSGVISIVAIVLIAQSSVNIYFRKLKADQLGSASLYQPMPGHYESFGPVPGGYDPYAAPATAWPHDPALPPGQPPGDSSTRVTPSDDSMWRPPGSTGDGGAPGGGHPLEPPR